MGTILITGADGFLGSRLCSEFNRSYRVIALVRDRNKLKRIGSPGANIEVVDDGSANIESLCADAEYIIHTATVYGRKDIPVTSLVQTNLLLPLRLLQSAGAGLRAFINTDSFFTRRSASELYGHLKEYTLSKLQLNEWLKQWRDVRVINMRLEHMYGVGDNPDKFVPSIIARLCSNESQIDLTDGLQERDFVYIDDVVQAFATVIRNIDSFSIAYHMVEVGSGIETSIRAFVETAKDLSGSLSKLHFGGVPRQTNEFETSCADMSVLSSLGYAPAFTIQKGIHQIINSLK